MENPLDFLEFDVIYTREGVSNKWTRKIERKAKPVKVGTKDIPLVVVHWEGEGVEDEKRVHCMVNVKCDPLLNDPNTGGIVPEDYQPYEEEALELTDKKFKKRHPKAEIIP